MKYIVGLDQFYFEGVVDKDKIPGEVKYVGDSGLPRVHGSPKRQMHDQLAECGVVCLEIPKTAMRGSGIKDHLSPRHLVMSGWEAREMASLLLVAADASDKGESFDSDKGMPGADGIDFATTCKCDMQVLAQGGPHEADCSKL